MVWRQAHVHGKRAYAATWYSIVFFTTQGLVLVLAVWYLRAKINSVRELHANLKMIIFHLGNFIGLEAVYAFQYYAVKQDESVRQVKMEAAAYMVDQCYFTYMTLFLFYLVYCFGKNRHLGMITCKESESAETVEDEVQGKRQL